MNKNKNKKKKLKQKYKTQCPVSPRFVEAVRIKDNIGHVTSLVRMVRLMLYDTIRYDRRD